MPDRDWLVASIRDSVHAGRTPEAACRHLINGGFDENQVRSALAQYEQETNRIRTLWEPRTLLGSRERAGWYAGPAPGDRFWPALKDYLAKRRGWDETQIRSLDEASDKVLSLLEAPGTPAFSTRGLVLGYVQSGKTANFTALIAKAADAGYRFFVVLSGMTDPLRTQTQQRLDRELVALNQVNWIPLTYPDTDFSPRSFQNATALLADGTNRRLLCVVKKNATRLRGLLRWLRSARAVLPDCPVLIVDDEADQASINTADPESRSRINKLLLDIIKELPKVAYVGYTATPFANVFIDPSLDDLYPRDFIVDLERPADYFGPERIFGRERLTHDDPDDHFGGLDMIRRVPDEEVPLLRPRGQQDWPTFEPQLAPCLERALQYFWLATAARHARDQAREHSSMLVHTTLYAAVHERFRAVIDGYRRQVLALLEGEDAGLMATLNGIWEEELARVPAGSVDERATPFEALRPFLVGIVERSEVVIENSRSQLRLAYGESPRIVVVVGGNTLSRGLTLEGLVVSLFVRTSSAYDTLLQMGRWFGYRRGYADLPRVWMTDELRDYFQDLATVEEEMRLDVRRYGKGRLTPLEFAVRIRTHPALSITARAKMQAAVPCYVSYAGRMVQTILFSHRDQAWLDRNREAAAGLLRSARAASRETTDLARGGLLMRGIPASQVLAFIDAYGFHPDNLELQPRPLQGYIAAQMERGLLHRWNVVVVGPQAETNRPRIPLLPDLSVPLLVRSRLRPRPGTEDTARLGVITSKVDWVADLDLPLDEPLSDDAAELARLRSRKLPDVGAVLLYPIDKDSRPRSGKPDGPRVALDAVDHLIGVAFLFPETNDLTQQQYMSVDLSRIERDPEEAPPEEEETA